MKSSKIKGVHFLITIIIFTIVLNVIGNTCNTRSNPNNNAVKIKEYKNSDEVKNKAVCFILFHTKNSLACDSMQSSLSRLISSGANANLFYRVNAEKDTLLCNEYNISGVPCIIILNHGIEKNRIMGVIPYRNLKMIYNRHVDLK